MREGPGGAAVDSVLVPEGAIVHTGEQYRREDVGAHPLRQPIGCGAVRDAIRNLLAALFLYIFPIGISFPLEHPSRRAGPQQQSCWRLPMTYPCRSLQTT